MKPDVEFLLWMSQRLQFANLRVQGISGPTKNIIIELNRSRKRIKNWHSPNRIFLEISGQTVSRKCLWSMMRKMKEWMRGKLWLRLIEATTTPPTKIIKTIFLEAGEKKKLFWMIFAPVFLLNIARWFALQFHLISVHPISKYIWKRLHRAWFKITFMFPSSKEID